MSLPLNKRVVLKSVKSGKSLRIRDNLQIDGNGKEGKFAQFDVVEGKAPGTIRLHSIGHPGMFLGIKRTGELFAGKGGDLCEFKVSDTTGSKKPTPNAIILEAVNVPNPLKDNTPSIVGILGHGGAKHSFKVGRGLCAQFLVQELGDADQTLTRAVTTGTYQKETSAAAAAAPAVAISPENKRALLIGCNYPGTDATLRGCINDVMMMKNNLLKYKGFQEKNIKVMIDTDTAYERPTGKNIKLRLRELVMASKAGDVLVLHFSGHGTQVPAEAGSEKDGKDEAIVPTDFNLLTDNDLRKILEEMPRGVIFTFISDCCHSGGILDNKSVQIGAEAGTAAKDIAPFGGTRDYTHENRSLSTDLLAKQLGVFAGTEVAPTNIHRSLFSLFGPSSSSSSISFMSSFSSLLGLSFPSSPDEDDDLTPEDDMLVSFFGPSAVPPKISPAAPYKPPPPFVPPPAPAPVTVVKPPTPPAPTPLLAQTFGGSTTALYNAPLPAAPAPYKPTAGVKPPADELLFEEKGILICGCQSSQTSADVCPGDPSKAYGALTHTLTTILATNPNIAFFDLVAQIRTTLAKGGFTQQPGLECMDANAKRPFICPSV